MNHMTVIARSAADADTETLSIADLAEREGEPRVRDIDLAERLGFRKSLNIRDTIARNRKELAAYGPISATVAENADPIGRGRPGKEYWLNEGQALVICALSRTPKAAAIRKQIIDVFMAYRAGRLAPAASAPAEPAMLSTADDLAMQLGLINARIDMLAALTARVGEAVDPGIRGEFRDMLNAADRQTVTIGSGVATNRALPPMPTKQLPAPASERRGKKAGVGSGADLLYGMPAIARHLKIRERQGYHLAERFGLPVFRLGRKLCATRVALDAWIAESALAAEGRS